MKDKIKDSLNELTVETWWDYGDYTEIRDKDYVASCIYDDFFEEQQLILEYIERKYGVVINREDLDNFIERL